MPLAADLAVLPELLGRMIDDPDFQRGLKRIQGSRAAPPAACAWAGSMPDVAVEVDAVEIDARGRYEAVPYPFAFQGGRLTYTREALTLRGRGRDRRPLEAPGRMPSSG